MNCLLNLLSICLLDPSNVYVRAEMSFQLQKPQMEGRWCQTRWCNGPMGTLRIGSTIQITRTLEADYGFLHTSFINTNRDRGEESAYLSLTWRPNANR